MKTIVQLILFTATISLVGYAIKRLIFRRIETSRIEEMTLALGFGLGFTPLLMFDLAFAGARLSPRNLLLLLSLLVSISLAFVWRGFRGIRLIRATSRVRLSPLERALTALIVSAVVFAFVLALSKPFDVWDAVTTWGFKAKVLYHEQTIYTDAFLDRDGALTRIRPRPQYPLGWPMLEYLVAVFVGAFDESNLKFVSALLFGLLVLAMYAACRTWFPRRHALLACALFVSIPFIYYQTVFRLLLVGGKKSAILGGMADLPLACFVFLSATSLFHWFIRPVPAYLVTAAVFSAAAGFTKNEGLAISAVMMGTLGLFILVHRQTRSWSSLATFMLIWLVLVGPWLLFQQTLPLELQAVRFVWSGAEVVRTLHTLPRVTRFFVQEAGNFLSWGLIWMLWVVLSLLSRRQMLATPLKYLYVIILGGLLVDLLVVALAPVGNVQRAFFQSRTLARLLFHFAPLAIFLILQMMAHEKTDRFNA
ncbi:MAG: hypothetical protein HY314_00715 [Acidobacteria bacterium]|nr:hypothetical protein [Acidobacteriota bacterium]